MNYHYAYKGMRIASMAASAPFISARKGAARLFFCLLQRKGYHAVSFWFRRRKCKAKAITRTRRSLLWLFFEIYVNGVLATAFCLWSFSWGRKLILIACKFSWSDFSMESYFIFPGLLGRSHGSFTLQRGFCLNKHPGQSDVGSRPSSLCRWSETR